MLKTEEQIRHELRVAHAKRLARIPLDMDELLDRRDDLAARTLSGNVLSAAVYDAIVYQIGQTITEENIL